MSITGPIAIPDPAPWMTEALCAQSDPDAWFPERGDSVSIPRRVCQDCPVRVECLTHAIDTGEREGIWGGMTGYQRRAFANGRIRFQDCPHCGERFAPSGPGQTFCSRSCSAINRHKREVAS